MTEENANQVLGQPMPPFAEGPAVDSLSPEGAQSEWQLMTTGDKKYENWPRNVFLKRRDQLFERGFKEKLTKQKETQEEEGRKFLEDENQRIQDREEHFLDQKAKELNIQFFGNEKIFNQVAERAVEVVSQLSETDQEFLRNCMPNSDLSFGDSPLIIGFLANISSDSKLVERVKANGLEHYISLLSKLPRRAKR